MRTRASSPPRSVWEQGQSPLIWGYVGSFRIVFMQVLYKFKKKNISSMLIQLWLVFMYFLISANPFSFSFSFNKISHRFSGMFHIESLKRWKKNDYFSIIISILLWVDTGLPNFLAWWRGTVYKCVGAVLGHMVPGPQFVHASIWNHVNQRW